MDGRVEDTTSDDSAARMNIILMHCHDIGRFLASYGHPTVCTPNLDRLAREGVRFENAFCAAPQCSPSRAALFTGRYPHRTGVLGLTHAGFGWDMSSEVPHIARLLSEAGYDCELIGVHHESRMRSDDEVAAQLGFASVRTGGRADEVADHAVRSLRDRAESIAQPFYLQVGFVEPHRVGATSRGDARKGFLGDYIEPDESLGVAVPGYLQDDALARAEMAELQGAVRYMDAAVGHVLDEVDRLGLADDSIVLFTTDHGLALPRAKCTLYDPGIETALIARAPRLNWSGGRSVQGLVSNVDVVPTLLEAVGVTFPNDLDGHSLVKPLSNERAFVEKCAPGFRDHIYSEITFHSYYDPRRAVRTGDEKLIVNFDSVPAYMATVSQSGRPWSVPVTHAAGPAHSHAVAEYYDLREDPLELDNRIDCPAVQGTVAELSQRLLEWMVETGDPLLQGPVESPAYGGARDFLSMAAGRSV